MQQNGLYGNQAGSEGMGVFLDRQGSSATRAYFGLLVVKDGESDVGDDDRLGQLVVPLPHRRRPARAHLERVVAEPQVVGGDHQHVLAVHLLGW